jgi:hypothetical protein
MLKMRKAALALSAPFRAVKSKFYNLYNSGMIISREGMKRILDRRLELRKTNV